LSICQSPVFFRSHTPCSATNATGKELEIAPLPTADDHHVIQRVGTQARQQFQQLGVGSRLFRRGRERHERAIVIQEQDPPHRRTVLLEQRGICLAGKEPSEPRGFRLLRGQHGLRAPSAGSHRRGAGVLQNWLRDALLGHGEACSAAEKSSRWALMIKASPIPSGASHC
jgi:hypothetical protein